MKRKFTKREITQREEIENQLRQIAPLPKVARELITPQGFVEFHLEMRDLYPSYLEAYERLEFFYKKIFGSRKYEDYHSFRATYDRIMEKISI